MGRRAVEISDLDRATASVIKEAMQDLQFSQADLARASGIYEVKISRYLNCERSILLDDLMKIAEALQTKASSIVRRAEELLAARESVLSRENVPPVSSVELDLSRWNVAAYTLDERDEEIEFP